MRALAAIALLALVGCGGGGDGPARDRGDLDRRLIEAAFANDVEAARRLIEQGAAVRRLLEAGIDRDHVNRLGWTALHEGVVLGDGGPDHVATVRALVRGGADVGVPDGDGVTALQHARERGFRAIVRALD